MFLGGKIHNFCCFGSSAQLLFIFILNVVHNAIRWLPAPNTCHGFVEMLLYSCTRTVVLSSTLIHEIGMCIIVLERV